jgi:hypothetical protein
MAIKDIFHRGGEPSIGVTRFGGFEAEVLVWLNQNGTKTGVQFLESKSKLETFKNQTQNQVLNFIYVWSQNPNWNFFRKEFFKK